MTITRARGPVRAVRADAQRNRAHLLAVAQDVFAREGVDVPIDEIARRSGVGIGTVYRHFPTKEALVLAVVRERIAAMVADAKARAKAADPGVAFFEFIAELWRGAAHKKDLIQALNAAGLEVKKTALGPTTELKRAMGTLLRRAQAAGAVREGVATEDVLALMSLTYAAVARTHGSPERLFAIVCDGLRASARPV